MSKGYLLLACLGAILMMAAAAGVLMRMMQEQARMQLRLQQIRGRGQELDVAAPRGHAGHSVRDAVEAMGLGLARSGLLSAKTVEGLKQTLASAGIRSSNALGLFVGSKLLLLALLPLLAFFLLPYAHLSPFMRNVGLAVSALVGMLGPDWYIGRRHKRYVKAVEAGLPDALDLMVICAEAGLGFEPAISRVSQEIRLAHAAISEELGQTANELRLIADARVVLLNMGGRTGLNSLRRVGATLAQTMQYGTPLSDALRVLSAEMRHEMMVRFEARAARLPVLLTLPMIVCILPCIFLIVGGPAAIQVLHRMSH